MSEKQSQPPQIKTGHPLEYQNDLNPERGTSQNLGKYTVTGDPNHKTAADNKYLVNMFHDRFTMDELRQLPIVPPGTHLKQGAIYLDLVARDSGPQVAHGRVIARDDQYFVPKAEVPYELWNKLTDMDS